MTALLEYFVLVLHCAANKGSVFYDQLPKQGVEDAYLLEHQKHMPHRSYGYMIRHLTFWTSLAAMVSECGQIKYQVSILVQA